MSIDNTARMLCSQKGGGSASFAISAYHRGNLHYLAWFVPSRRIALTKHIGHAKTFGTLGAAYTALDQIDRLHGEATIVEVSRPYVGVGLVGRDPDEVILGWKAPCERKAPTPQPAGLVDAGDLPADWVARQMGIARREVWSRPDAIRRAEASHRWRR
jgi:hypothetical protein